MILSSESSGLYTDFYELTMAQGYFLSGRKNDTAVFDYFFRKNPFKGGFVIFAGLGTLIEQLETYRFDQQDCDYLHSLGFDKKFLEYLKNFRFSGDLLAFKEGEVAFPYEPLLRVEGNIIETQLVESLLLNILNFQSLIATKAARMKLAAGDKTVMEFGLRRAQGLGAIHASRAAIIGGCEMTSNTLSARMFDLKPSGTMAHSWVQSFENETKSFSEYTRHYREKAVLLVDTYNTLNSGVPNAINVAKDMEKNGQRLFGIRLDSGDLAYLSKKTRKMLDEAGLKYVKILVSNQLDEYLIRSLLEQNAPIDAFGVGTSLATGMADAALDGVYKLAMINQQPTMKISENISKMTLPGKKEIFRYYDSANSYFYADGLELSGLGCPDTIVHPFLSEKKTVLARLESEKLLHKVMEKGRIVSQKLSIQSMAEYTRERLNHLAEENKRFENPHIYKVGISGKLLELRNQLKENL